MMWGDVTNPSWRTLRATIRTQKDLGVWRRAIEQAVRPPAERVTESGGRIVQISGSASASATLRLTPPAGFDPDPMSYLWVRLPDAMRTDEPFGIERLVRVHRGELKWTAFGPRDVRESAAANPVPTHPLLFPGTWAQQLELVSRDPVWHADRQAVEVRARPVDRVRVASLSGDLPPLPIDAPSFHAADEYVVVVDLEHGVVLRFEARIDGELIELIELTDVTFDGEIDEDLFVVTPPPGGFLPPPPGSVSATIDELAEQVGFVLFHPTWPDGVAAWHNRRATYRPADPSRDTPAQVTYSVPLHPGVLWLHLSDQELPDEHGAHWASHPLGRAWTDPDHPDERSKLRFHRDGTHLHLEASLRTLDWLERVAAGLVPVDGDDG